MPFDGLVRPPTLEEMPAILRDRSRWPEGFEWDYDRVDHCALGLGRCLGADTLVWRKRLGPADDSRVFWRTGGKFKPRVTPEIVADRLEQVLPRHPLPPMNVPSKAMRFFDLALAAAMGPIFVIVLMGVM